MRDILFFMAGAGFALILTAVSLFLAFTIVEYKENTEIRREEKKKLFTLKQNKSGGNVIKPKTPQQKRLEEDETAQAFSELFSRDS